MPSEFFKTLETFPNPFVENDYILDTVCPEFTSVCPKTGQPDYATIRILYIPDVLCYELKQLKLYLQQYRNHGAFYERVTNMIFEDLWELCMPRWLRIDAAFTPRGGIRSTASLQRFWEVDPDNTEDVIRLNMMKAFIFEHRMKP